MSIYIAALANNVWAFVSDNPAARNTMTLQRWSTEDSLAVAHYGAMSAIRAPV
jgi:hypothetical protein